MDVLTLDHLSKHYGRNVALDDVTISFEKGKITGLLGPNGSGKTTMLKIASGLLCPSQGECRINGMIPGKETKAVVSYLPDRNYLPDWVTVPKILDMFSDFYKDFDRTKAEKMISQLNINESMTTKQMSKGTKEKLQLILVMSRKASLYLLDEPIGGVDPATRDYILNTIINNYNEDSAVVISTHLISDVESVLDDVVFINNGKIILSSSVDDIRERHNKSVDEYFREVFSYEKSY